jgi:MFS family permease
MGIRFTGLWHHPDFRRLWSAQAASLIGSQVSFLALPLLVTLTLNASPLQIGILAAAGALPALLFGLFAGVWVDRLRRRPLLIAADLGRALLLLSIPLAAILDALRIEYLYVVAFFNGALTLVFDVAHQSLLPALVGREQLVEGNSKLELSRSAAEIGGPGLAGGLIQMLTPPFALAVDALSYLLSALLLGRIRAAEPAPSSPTTRRNIRREIEEGLRAVFGSPLLRPLALGTATVVCFSSLLEAVFFLYLARTLQLAPIVQGVIFATGNIGFLVGAVVAERAARRFGIGPTLAGAVLLVGVADLAVPAASVVPLPAAALLVAAQCCFGIGIVAYNINAVSLRQALTPDHLQGRVNASFRFLAQGIVPLGALLGGVLGERFGIRPTLLIGAVGELTAVVWLLLPSVRRAAMPADPLEEPSHPRIGEEPGGPGVYPGE